MLRFLVSLVAVLALSAPCAPAAGAQDMLHVVTMNAPPMVIVREDGLTGMAADLAQEALSRAGFKYRIEIAPWKRAVYMASVGLADALFYPLYSEERAKVFYYPSTPLFSIDLVALRRADSGVTIRPPDYKGLENYTLGVGRGFNYGLKAKEIIRKAGFKRIEETAFNKQGFQQLLSGRVDLMLIDRTLASYFLKLPETRGKADYTRDEQGGMQILDSRDGYMVFSRKTTTAEDAERFSRALDAMKLDGTYQAIVDKYQ